ncbi:MAG TPA: iron-containing alcohol dehydrogenase [Methylomirabilota bacterium]|nr:iron-containing alcohol dehydrogenase [Methylomirabilota bacterium]
MEHSVSSTQLPVAAFDYQPRTRLIFGPNTIDRIGDLARNLGATRVLLVTDKGIIKAGHADRVIGLLRAAGLQSTTYDSVQENPTTRDVDECVKVAREAQIDFIVGLGGGSAMDTAKGCNFILTNGGRMQDYWGIGKATQPMLPLIAVPTTAGTGSECQSFALIADENTHQKMACGDPKAAARIAILDPTLTLSQPQRVTACTGIDAIAHAVETAVTKKKNALSWLFAREAFQLCMTGFDRVLSNPSDVEARGRMLLGAAYAGTAIENSMLGAAHSAANPLTAHFNIIHGHAVGLMLPHVVRFNAHEPAAARAYAEIALLVHLVDPATPGLKAADVLSARLLELLTSANLPARLRDCGVEAAKIPVMAEEAARQWTATFNPRPITRDDFISLYQAAW